MKLALALAGGFAFAFSVVALPTNPLVITATPTGTGGLCPSDGCVINPSSLGFVRPTESRDELCPATAPTPSGTGVDPSSPDWVRPSEWPSEWRNELSSTATPPTPSGTGGLCPPDGCKIEWRNERSPTTTSPTPSGTGGVCPPDGCKIEWRNERSPTTTSPTPSGTGGLCPPDGCKIEPSPSDLILSRPHPVPGTTPTPLGTGGLCPQDGCVVEPSPSDLILSRPHPVSGTPPTPSGTGGVCPPDGCVIEPLSGNPGTQLTPATTLAKVAHRDDSEFPTFKCGTAWTDAGEKGDFKDVYTYYSSKGGNQIVTYDWTLTLWSGAASAFVTGTCECTFWSNYYFGGQSQKIRGLFQGDLNFTALSVVCHGLDH